MNASKQTYLRAIVALVIIALIVVGPIWDVTIKAKASPDDAEFYDTEQVIIARKFATPSGGTGKSFTLNNLVPYFHAGGPFETHFSATVKWDGYAVAAAFVPAVLEDYKYTNPNYDGQIIAKRPTLVGLIAVFRGSHHEGTIPNGYYTSDDKLENGKIYLHVATRSYTYQYTIEITTTTTNKVEVAEEAWIKARVGISLGLKLLDFAKASLDLASVEAGVSYSVKLEQSTSTTYTYKVTFSIPTYEIKINYQSYVVDKEITNIYSNGNGPTPTDKNPNAVNRGKNKIIPADSYTEINYYQLNAAGTYTGYSDYLDMSPYTGYHTFNGGDTIGIIVFNQD